MIDDAAQHHKDIPDLMKKLGAIGALGPYIPEEYGGAGLDEMSYGLIMQEFRTRRLAVRSAASVQSSLAVCIQSFLLDLKYKYEIFTKISFRRIRWKFWINCNEITVSNPAEWKLV